LNPRLVHCSVSGFGADSPLADRPGMDTTIQGMAGVMDLTRGGGTPYKTGISIADLTGGQLSLAGVLAALAFRDRTGKGVAIDLSMHDAGAWLTRLAWNESPDGVACARIACTDGYAVAMASAEEVAAALGSATVSDEVVTSALTRAEVEARLAAQEIACAPVLRVSEAAEHAQTRAREIIVRRSAEDGTEWPLLASPMRLALTPTLVKQPIGAAAPDASAICREWSASCAPARSTHAV
jgi:crotonobetainyl-CoA:carnitine CoA-transferase CaiB-like acyl-CoA transferase